MTADERFERIEATLETVGVGRGGARPGAGRKKKLTACPFCRRKLGVVEFRGHFSRCPKRKG